jgi:hypothetical protein
MSEVKNKFDGSFFNVLYFILFGFNVLKFCVDSETKEVKVFEPNKFFYCFRNRGEAVAFVDGLSAKIVFFKRKIDDYCLRNFELIEADLNEGVLVDVNGLDFNVGAVK